MADDVHGVQAKRLDPTRALQQKLYRAAKRSRSRRFHQLFDKVCRRDFLWRAWREVARRGGASGVDGITIEAIEKQGPEHLIDELATELKEGRYRPLPVRRVSIPKRNGGSQRHLGVPAVRDRIVQACVKLVIEPIFEADFADCSFGFRPRRSPQDARERIRKGLFQGRRWVVDADIKGFFDHLDHGLLFACVRERISDRKVVNLIAGWLAAGVLTGDELIHPRAGTPQGGVVSPLMANVYLNRLDQVWQGHYRLLGEMTRYADDLVILCGSKDRAEAALTMLERLLSQLGLELAQAKTRIVDMRSSSEGFDFLGYHFRMVPTKRNPKRLFAACWPSRSAMAEARERIRQLTPLERLGLPTIVVVQDINEFLRGWGEYFRHGNSARQFHNLDGYVFERVARIIARKHGSRNWQRGMVDLIESRTGLGLYRLQATVGYPSASATR